MRKSLCLFICSFVSLVLYGVPVTNFSVISVSADGDSTAVVLNDIKKIMFKREGGKTYMNAFSRSTGAVKSDGRRVLFGMFTTDDGTVVKPPVPVDTTDKIEPIDTLKPIDPIEPSDTLQPIEPVEPSDTLKPIDPVEPSDTLQPIEPVEPSDTLQPTDPVEPSDTLIQVDPELPSDTLKPIEPEVDNGDLDDNEENYVNPIPAKKPDCASPLVTYEIEQEAEEAKAKFAVYPNPVVDYLTITGVEEDTPVVIYSIKGKVTISTRGTKINVSNLAPGEYVLSVKEYHLVFMKR